MRRTMDRTSGQRRKPLTYGKSSRTFQQQVQVDRTQPRSPNSGAQHNALDRNDIKSTSTSSIDSSTPPALPRETNLEASLEAEDVYPASKKRKTLAANEESDSGKDPNTSPKSRHHIVGKFPTPEDAHASIPSHENSPLRRAHFQRRQGTIPRHHIDQKQNHPEQSDLSNQETRDGPRLDRPFNRPSGSRYGRSNVSRQPSAPIHSPARRGLIKPIQNLSFDRSTSGPFPSMSEEGIVASVPASPATSAQTSKAKIVETPGRRRLIDSLETHESQDAGEFDGPGSDSASSSESSRSAVDHPREVTHQRPQNVLYATSQSRSSTDQYTSSTPSSQPVSSKITYARQRSFLSSLDLSETSLNPSDDTHYPIQDPGITGTGNTGQMTGGDTNGISSVRSIHELRQAGGNARYQGIVGSLLDDVEDSSSSVSARRSALLHLCEKLTDKRFAQRFVESASFERLTSNFSNPSDTVSCFLGLCSYTLLGQAGTPSMALTRSFWPKLLAFIPHLIDLDENIIVLMKQRRYNLSKATQAGLEQLYSHLRDRELPPDELPSWISPRRLLLHCILLSIRKSREKSESIEIFPAPALASLINTLVDRSGNVSSLDPYSKDFITLQMISSILEAHATLSNSLGIDYKDAIKPLKDIYHLLVALCDASDNRCKQLLLTLLRLILNITNDNSLLCEHFATPELIKGLVRIVLSSFEMASGDFIGENKDSLDTVILALGALINLTEEIETSRKIIFTSELNEQTLLTHLIGLLSGGFDTMSEANSVVQTHSNVAFGYLSILLGTLCLDGDIRASVKGSIGLQGLERILSTVDEFLLYHRKVDEELNDPEIRNDPSAEFSLRLQRILTSIRKSEGGGFRS